MKRVVIFLILLMMTGCVSKYKTEAYEAPSQILQTNASAYVAMASNGIYGNTEYQNSGYFLSSAIATAISLHIRQVEQAKNLETIEESLSISRKMGIKYLFQPIILHWEDRSTEWSGKTDKITIKIIVWDVEAGNSISSTVVKASSKWGTLGGDHPQDLLPGAIDPFINDLFNK